MKIRNGYVSNSSSSSYVIKNLDMGILLSLINKFIDNIDFNDEDSKFYAITKDGVCSVFQKKLKINDVDELDCYLNNEFYGFFADLFDAYVTERNYELSNCKKCEYYETDFQLNKLNSKCCRCQNKYLFKQFTSFFDDVIEFTTTFNEFDFTEDIKEIKNAVDKLSTENRFDDIVVKVDYKHKENLIDKKVSKYRELWKQKYPNAFVLSFASDVGDMQEAYLRCMVYNFATFLKGNGVDGFIGENS